MLHWTAASRYRRTVLNKLLSVVVACITGCSSSTTTIPERLGETVEVPNDDGTVDRYVNIGNGTVFVEENFDLDEEAKAEAEAKARLAAMSPKERYAIMVNLHEGNHLAA